MGKVFIIKNSDGKESGEIVYSKKKFKVNIVDEKEAVNVGKMLNTYLKGIRQIGDIILKEPILPEDPLFLGEVQNQLAIKGYIFIEKNK